LAFAEPIFNRVGCHTLSLSLDQLRREKITLLRYKIQHLLNFKDISLSGKFFQRSYSASLLAGMFCLFALLTGCDFIKEAFSNNSATNKELPPLVAPILFNTVEADKWLSSMQILPPDSPWNTKIATSQIHPDSDLMIESVGAELALKFNLDMGFVIVPPNQPKVDVVLGEWAAESDKGPYPIPPNAPIENWPLNGETLEHIQEFGSGDRHVIVVDPLNNKLYELGEVYKKKGVWSASVAVNFDLNTNRARPKFWTSADASGLPIFPAVIRFDELERGQVNHAMRFTVEKSRRAFVHPASHFASQLTDRKYPAMGQRFRLKATANLNGLSPHALAVAKGLQEYGMFVADNGGNWRLSVAPDSRIKGLNDLSRFKGKDFEVIAE
jgi:hypothetical protein